MATGAETNDKAGAVYVPEVGDKVSLYTYPGDGRAQEATVKTVHAPGNDRSTITAEYVDATHGKMQVLAFNRAVTKQGHTYEQRRAKPAATETETKTESKKG